MTRMIAPFDGLRSVDSPGNTTVCQPGLTLLKAAREAVYRYPSVCIVMPFNPTMKSKNELANQLEIALAKVESKLTSQYPDDVCKLVLPKLRTILRNVNFNTHKKSLALFLSPVFEKVMYFNLPVEENIFVDESFDMRSLLNCKKQTHDYLLFLPGSYDSRIYLGNKSNLTRLLSNTPKARLLSLEYRPQRESVVANPSQCTSARTEALLYQADQLLHQVLNAWPLPLFVMGTAEILTRFKKVTRHSAAIIDYLPGHDGRESEERIKKTMSTHVNDWEAVCQKDLENKLKKAAVENKLATGINEVWQLAMNGRGSLLLVEKNRIYLQYPENAKATIAAAPERYNSFSCIRSAEDEVIEKVLTNGGDVVMVEQNGLNGYDHIALI